MKMNAYGYTKDTVVRAAKMPCMMVMSISSVDPEQMAEPAMIHVVGDEVWVTDWSTFMDAGFEAEHSIIPIAANEGWDSSKEMREAWLVFDDICEYGEPGSVVDNLDRKAMMSAMYKFKTGIDLVFKKEEC